MFKPSYAIFHVLLPQSQGFRKKWMREIDIVDYLLDLDDIFKESYYHYQRILTAIKNKDIESFEEILNNVPENISGFMMTSIKTLQDHKVYIINSLKYKYFNGVIEGTNNLIKVIKRITFGYRSFIHFKSRILLIANTMVKSKH